MPLSEEDKQWMLVAFPTRSEWQTLQGDMQGLKTDVQVLKTDMQNMKTEQMELKADVRQLKADLHLLDVSVSERIERVETTLLTEFHKWASPAEARQRGQQNMIVAIDQELELLKERVKKIEDRLAS